MGTVFLEGPSSMGFINEMNTWLLPDVHASITILLPFTMVCSLA